MLAEQIRFFFQHPLVIFLYYLGAILIAELWQWGRGHIKADAFMIAATGMLALLVLNLALSAVFGRVTRTQEVDERIRDLTQIIQAQHLGWIVNERYIRSVEFGSNRTWVFSIDLTNDLNTEGEIFQAVRANLKEKHSYIYFLPKSPLSFKCVGRYHDLHTYNEGQVRFYLIPQEVYLFYTEVVVYHVGGREEVAIEWLPQDDLNYYIAMDQRHTAHVVGIGEMFMNSYKEHKPGEAHAAAS
jgi:hypothetical protein